GRWQVGPRAGRRQRPCAHSRCIREALRAAEGLTERTVASFANLVSRLGSDPERFRSLKRKCDASTDLRLPAASGHSRRSAGGRFQRPGGAGTDRVLDVEDRQLIEPDLFSGWEAHRVHFERDRNSSGLDGAHRRRLAGADHGVRRPGGYALVVPRRIVDPALARAWGRNERAALSGSAGWHRSQAADGRWQGNESTRDLVAGWALAHVGIEPAQWVSDRPLHL